MAAVKGKVVSCTGLRNVDLIGKSDPFVRITLEDQSGEKKGEAKTATKTDDLNPVWEDESFNFACSDDDLLEYKIRFKVMDTGLGPDVELGEALVPLKLVPLLDEGKGPQEFNLSLGIKKGRKPLGKIQVHVGIVASPSWFG
mmetsp:Transcript_121171/g.343290  ORF Transcript_121171/g.343290 Transcript_121171/m.343290 type:complete len:142 (-) Transcript_121171:133-558(-)